MSLPLSVLICLSVVQLCMGDQPVEEVITANQRLLGSWFEGSPESTEAKEAAQYAVKQYNMKSKGKWMFKLVSIEAVQIQVTNMINYKIEAVLGKTKCRKSENHDLDNCNPEKKQLNCVFEVTFNPRNNTHGLGDLRCRKLAEKI